MNQGKLERKCINLECLPVLSLLCFTLYTFTLFFFLSEEHGSATKKAIILLCVCVVGFLLCIYTVNITSGVVFQPSTSDILMLRRTLTFHLEKTNMKVYLCMMGTSRVGFILTNVKCLKMPKPMQLV